LHGRASGRVHGQFPSNDLQNGEVRLALALSDGSIRVGKPQASFRQANIDGVLHADTFSMNYRLDVWSGSASGQGRFPMSEGRPLQVSWNLRNADLTQAVTAIKGSAGRASGRLTTAGSISVTPERPDTRNGSMSGTVEDGDLLQVPVVSVLVNLVRSS